MLVTRLKANRTAADDSALNAVATWVSHELTPNLNLPRFYRYLGYCCHPLFAEFGSFHLVLLPGQPVHLGSEGRVLLSFY